MAVLAAVGLFLTGLARADHMAGGEVKEIIIKIETKDGTQWYRLGKDLEEIDINEGDYVNFDYADDTIESIEVEEEGEESQGSSQSAWTRFRTQVRPPVPWRFALRAAGRNHSSRQRR